MSNPKHISKLVLAGFFLSFLVFLGTSSFAQEKELRKGMEHYNYQEFADAIPWFKKALKKNKELYSAEKYLANSYRKARILDFAELHYLLVVNSDSVQAEDYLYYGQVLKANGKLAAAKEQFLKFSELAENSFLGNLMIQSIDEIKVWEEEPKEYNINPESKLNSEKSEFGFCLFKDKVYIVSDRGENFYSTEKSAWSGDPFLAIYEADTAYLNNPESDNFRMEKGLINTQFHDGPLSITPQEDRVIISRISNEMRGKDFVNRMKLYEGQYVNGKWKEFKPFPYNSDEYSVGHAVYADSGKSIYFSSDMPGGFGGMDLYKCQWVDNQWSKPKNLGPVINTQQNEVFPYVKDDQLYFSSNGFVGLGGLDIFLSQKQGDSWKAPENMKRPINSNRDDFSIYFVTDSTGFYASNREGGIGKDDIYSFVKTPPQIEVELKAVLEYKGLPVEGIKVSLINELDSIVQVAYTDENGRIQFKDLPYQSNYLIQLQTEDGSDFEGGRLFQLDELNKKVRLLHAGREGLFSFKALPVDEIRLNMESEVDPGTLEEFVFLGKVFKKLPGDVNDRVMVYLLNDEGVVIDSVLTDEFGNFSFEKLDSEENYLIQIAEEDPELNIALVTKEGRIYNLAERTASGKFEIENQLDASQQLKKATNNGFTTLIARLEHQGIPLKYSRVQIFDVDNNLVATVISNENGEFQYNMLEFDNTYFINLPDVEDTIKYHTLAYVLNTEGDPLYLINQLKDGTFQFNALPFDEYKNIQQIEKSFVPNIVKVAGQIYKKLPGDFEDGTMIYVLSEDGEILDSVITDGKGRFVFEKLAADENYTFKIAEGNEAFNLALLDKDNIIIDKAILNGEGNFAYKKLTYQVAQFEQLDLVETHLVEDAYSHQVFGQVYQKLPGDFGDSLKVFIYDEEGNFLGTAYTDMEGKFTFEKLKSDQNYFFKIEHRDEDFQLLTFDEEANIVDKVIKNRFGQFKYAKLDMHHHEILLEEASDHQVMYYDNERIDLTKYTVHYRFDKSNLESSEVEKLDKLVEVLKGKEGIKLEIISHTDTRGPKEYNLYLSQQRTKTVIAYLEQKGIFEDLFVPNYYGELRPIIDCEKYNCNNEDHRLNRRTEFKFIDLEIEN